MANYTGRLAMIGNRLDKERCRSVAILEVSENYIIRAIDSTNGMPALSEWLIEDFKSEDVRLSRFPAPSSYESILKVIGEHLDSRVAANVSIIECPSCYQIVGWERGNLHGHLTYLPFEETLDRHTLEHMVSNNR